MFFKCMSKSGRRSTPCGRGVQQSEHSNSRVSLRKPASQRFRYEQVAGIVYPVYASGKWIEITSGQPIKHGRYLWGSGADYGKTLNSRAPVWRRRERDDAAQDRSAARHQRQNNRARHLHAVHRSEVEPLDTDRVELESADAPRPEVSREQPGAASIAAAIRPLKVLD